MKDNYFHGFGRFIYCDGGSRVGWWKKGQPHGNGLSYYPDG